MPGTALDAKHGLWRSLRKTRKGGYYLFNHKALAVVFRAQTALAALNAEGLTVPVCLPERWVVEKQERGQWPQGAGLSGPLPEDGYLHPATLAIRVGAATKTAGVRQFDLPGRRSRANFREMFSVPATGT